MAYTYSDIDNKNINWFSNDITRATLLSVQIAVGKVRGLERLTVDFAYPITAIAGRNGSGKSTVLALAACAFHNDTRGFRLPGRKNSYYTYSDFLIQTADEVSVGGIKIRYQILHNKWFVRGSGLVSGAYWQERVKRRGGRWTNYDSRVFRTVVFLGIDRIVPHSERSVSKGYRNLFLLVKTRGWEEEVRTVVGRILGIDYDSFEHKQHSKYRLPVVKCGSIVYSGFNMGAGEESLFELFSIAKECPDGSLIVIDEIELALHEQAQVRLIRELKTLCEQRKFQIICTTHSPRILDCLPPEGRIFLERVGKKINVIPGISSLYATGILTGQQTVELDILVEDESAKLIVETCLSQELRLRTRIIAVGSAAAVMRHLAAKYREKGPADVCVLLDGDKSSTRTTQINVFLKALENPSNQEDAKEWVEKRLSFLPGTEWPELWVINQANEAVYTRLCREFSITVEKVDEILSAAKRAGKHNEFYEAANLLKLDKIIVAHQLIKAKLEAVPEQHERIESHIKSFMT